MTPCSTLQPHSVQRWRFCGTPSTEVASIDRAMPTAAASLRAFDPVRTPAGPIARPSRVCSPHGARREEAACHRRPAPGVPWCGTVNQDSRVDSTRPGSTFGSHPCGAGAVSTSDTVLWCAAKTSVR
jgi:hypothetical protein